ncbi:tRNAHis guanylyltransferase-domain-containing protein [Dactylonectria estremocensis]|uniref:tRNA(His) guanylyltransferase n=1 Tax=Dactylonectria estremocensis TaxID=1079267 RepID=A0A9P9ETG1_9HYPO|nr:tRNAHis guanylyltransferase-domain-containing protein [Dactylonectria estremocensis]
MEEQPTPLSETPGMSLPTRMKDYEAPTEIRLKLFQPAILRLDGHTFSKFTAPFEKPFDRRLHTAMVKTCADLLEAYPSASLAYTQSDEITLVFPDGVGRFNGRVMKIATLAAGFCSVHFYSHLMAALAEMPEPAVKTLTSLPLPHFDGRIFNVPSVEECVNNIIWRCRGDAVRNSISAFARSLFSQKQLDGKNKAEMLELAKQEKGVTYEESVPKWAMKGSIVKKCLVKMEAVDMKTGEPVTVARTRTRCEDRGMTTFSAENLDLVRYKYWPEA